jgi:hypothetical protein
MNDQHLYDTYLGHCLLQGFAPGLCKLQKGCTRLAAANAKAYQLLAHGRWFSHGTPASYTPFRVNNF